MPHALFTEIIRTIKGSLARFLAIVGIVALGCGFFAGLKMASPDMQEAAHTFYKNQHLYDLRIISTLGLSEKDVHALASVEGVEAVMPSRTVDVMATLTSSQSSARVSSFRPGELNQPVVVEGRLPQGPYECVMSADSKKRADISLGHQIELPDTSNGVHLKGGSYTVVGFVNAPTYPYVSNFGTTSLGNGIVQQFVYVTEDAFANDDPYTEVYLTVQGATSYKSDSSMYQSTVDKVAERIKQMNPSLASLRLQELKDDAQAQVDEARQKLEQSRQEATDKLGDAQKKLDEAEAQISAQQQRLIDGQKQYDAGRQQLTTLRSSAEQKFAQAEAQIKASEAQIAQGTDELSAGEAQYQAGLAAFNAGQMTFTQQKSEFEAGRDAYLTGLAAQGITASTLEEAQQQLRALGLPTTQVDALLATQAQIAAAEAELAIQQQALAAARGELDQRTTQLREAESQVAQARKNLTEARSATADQLYAAQENLDASLSQLTAGQALLQNAESQTYEGRQSLEDQRAEIEKQLADGQTKIDEAQKKIDELKEPDVYVLDRTKEIGVAAYQADSERINNIANVFPLMFFLVAALVSLTSMTRMVSEERTLIGIHKALGYSTLQIAAKYLLYALLASLLGAVIGIALLSQVLPGVIISAYGSIYTIPNGGAPYPIQLDSALLAGLFGIGVTLLSTMAAVLSSLKEEPSSLMLPKAPKAGSKILLEHINPLWSSLSFSWKVTIRNLVRYKRRLIMTLVGIAGCTALLLVAFGLRDSISDVIDSQWPTLFHYDYIVGMTSDVSSEEADQIATELNQVGATNIHRITSENVLLESPAQNASSLTRTTIMTSNSLQDLTGVVALRDRLSGQTIEFEEDSVVISEKLAKRLGVGVGDTIQVFAQDRIGNASGEPSTLIVTGITENYVGSYLYVGPSAWHSLGIQDQATDSWYATLPKDQATRDAFGEKLITQAGVATIDDINEAIRMYKKSLEVVNRVVAILILAAALLAFIVLYNLTNINIEERIREIASLKVLGFTRHEVDAYVFREIALLAVFGALFGLVLGTYLEGFVVQTAEIDLVMFGRSIHMPSYWFAFGLTLVFSLLVYIAMRSKLKNIDMVESLKSVE
ncbi:FtsX-like permease family protein [Lancefieldella parvula]|uniref:FtsX-like permease family protein n=1 Tax=Lancefieldella parvula TaxID=1382 RepID=UPI00291026B7|nr:FtsX-like permease family protein [Lancefieldella parvula]MDU4868500.1 FtsX-like permease family protein [Lancefieldella parvula]